MNIFCHIGHVSPLLDTAPVRICIYQEVSVHSDLIPWRHFLLDYCQQASSKVYGNQFENVNALHKYRSFNEYFYLITIMISRYGLIHNPLYFKAKIKLFFSEITSQIQLKSISNARSINSQPSIHFTLTKQRPSLLGKGMNVIEHLSDSKHSIRY